MIEYSPGFWNIALIFKFKGSVLPKACAWAVPSAVLAALLQGHLSPVPESWNPIVGSYNFILGVLLVFRTQQAYARFWEGATILLQVRGEWVNCVSSCFSFCSVRPDMQKHVEHFQHLLVRLMSLCYCTALQQVSVLSDEAFDVFDLDGIDEECLLYLSMAPEKSLVVVQWIQQLIVTGIRTSVLEIPAPIVTRAFQELSRGVVNITSAQKITDILLPYPYAQMVTVMLIIFSVVTPAIAAANADDPLWAACLTFFVVLSFWSVNYIAAEIEMPFGEEPNDLPIAELQMGMNAALRSLLDARCTTPPPFEFKDSHKDCGVIKCPALLITDCQHFLWTYTPEQDQRLRTSTLKAGISRYKLVSEAELGEDAVRLAEKAVSQAVSAQAARARGSRNTLSDGSCVSNMAARKATVYTKYDAADWCDPHKKDALSSKSSTSIDVHETMMGTMSEKSCFTVAAEPVYFSGSADKAETIHARLTRAKSDSSGAAKAETFHTRYTVGASDPSFGSGTAKSEAIPTRASGGAISYSHGGITAKSDSSLWQSECRDQAMQANCLQGMLRGHYERLLSDLNSMTAQEVGTNSSNDEKRSNDQCRMRRCNDDVCRPRRINEDTAQSRRSTDDSSQSVRSNEDTIPFRLNIDDPIQPSHFHQDASSSRRDADEPCQPRRSQDGPPQLLRGKEDAARLLPISEDTLRTEEDDFGDDICGRDSKPTAQRAFREGIREFPELRFLTDRKPVPPRVSIIALS